jgi:hypothetical protein
MSTSAANVNTCEVCGARRSGLGFRVGGTVEKNREKLAD